MCSGLKSSGQKWIKKGILLTERLQQTHIPSHWMIILAVNLDGAWELLSLYVFIERDTHTYTQKELPFSILFPKWQCSEEARNPELHPSLPHWNLNWYSAMENWSRKWRLNSLHHHTSPHVSMCYGNTTRNCSKCFLWIFNSQTTLWDWLVYNQLHFKDEVHRGETTQQAQGTGISESQDRHPWSRHVIFDLTTCSCCCPEAAMSILSHLAWLVWVWSTV